MYHNCLTSAILSMALAVGAMAAQPEWEHKPIEIIRGHLPHMPLKPDPAGALAIAAEMGVAPAECWYLGDTAVDINTCHAAGMELIAVSWGFRSTEELIAAGAERIVDTPFQALSVIRSEN